MSKKLPSRILPVKKEPKADDLDLKMAMVCQCHAEMTKRRNGDSPSDSEVGERLGLHRSTVNKLLQAGRHRKVLIEEFNVRALDEKIRSKIPSAYCDPCKIVEGELQTLLEGRNITCSVMPSSEKSSELASEASSEGAEEYDRRLRDFAWNASLEILLKLSKAKDCKYVGITSGTTLAHIVSFMESRLLHRHDFKVGGIQFVPMAGDPMVETGIEGDLSSTLAEKLNRLTKPVSQAYLYDIPAVLPLLNAEATEVFRAFYRKHSKSYASIFSGKSPLVRQMNLMVSSIGSKKGPWSVFNQDLRGLFDADTKVEIEKLSCGDLGGNLILRDGQNPSLLKKYNNAWMGIGYKEIPRLVDRARVEGCGGVLLVGMGKGKKDILARIVEMKLCNSLILDIGLAEALRDHLQRKRPMP